MGSQRVGYDLVTNTFTFKLREHAFPESANLPAYVPPPEVSSASDALNKSQTLFVRMRGHSQRGKGLCHRLIGL